MDKALNTLADMYAEKHGVEIIKVLADGRACLGGDHLGEYVSLTNLNICFEILEWWGIENTTDKMIALFDLHFNPDTKLHEVDMSIQKRDMSSDRYSKIKVRGVHRKGIDPDLPTAIASALTQMKE